jgi:hypothetical protein
MARQIINIGTTVNDRSGDPLRTAFDKANHNFTELYSAVGADIQIPAQTGNNGKYLTTNGQELTWATIEPPSSTPSNSIVNGSYTVSVDTFGVLNVPLSQFNTAQVFAPTNETLMLGNSSHYVQIRGTDGAIMFPDYSVQSTAYPGIVNRANGSETLAVGVNILSADFLRVRLVAGMGDTLNVEIQYNRDITASVILTSTTVAYGVADESMNLWNGSTVLQANTTTWYTINANTLTTSGDMVTAIFADSSYHKMYRITVIVRHIPNITTLGDAYCSIEVLK